MWKYNKEKHSVDEQPTMTKPVLNRHAFKYAHIDSSKLDEYDKHIESLRLIPVQGKVDWKDGQEIPEDWFSLDNCDCKIGIDCPYKKGKWLTPCKLAYARKDKAIGIQEQPHPKDWLIFTGEIDNIPEPQSQERQQADKWGKYPHLSKWKSDYNEAIQKDITLPQYQKKFGEWLDNWIKENQSQEQQPVSDKEQPQQEANTYAILEAKYKKLLLEQNEMLRQQLNQPVSDKELKDFLVIRNEGQFSIWTKGQYDSYISKALEVGACPAVKLVTHFNNQDDLFAQLHQPVLDKDITHFHVADNSDAFRNWLKAKKISFTPNGHFTSILIDHDIFNLGAEFALYKQAALNKQGSDAVEFAELFQEFIDFSVPTFKDATALSSLEKLDGEIKEVAHEIQHGHLNLTEEYVDCMMCILDSAARMNISVADLRQSFINKLAINKGRVWKKNDNNTYSHTANNKII